MFKAGIIGCGGIAGGFDVNLPSAGALSHAGGYHLSQCVELISICDSDLKVAKEFSEKWGVKNYYSDYQKMITELNLDIVSICLPTELHFSCFTHVVKSDIKAIFCEKPLAKNLEEALEMEKISINIPVSINYFRRWNLKISDLKADIDAKKFGDHLHTTARYTKGLLGNGSHVMHLIEWLFGEPTNISGVEVCGDSPSHEIGVNFTYNYDINSKVDFRHIPTLNYIFIDIDILFSDARIILSQRGQRLSIEKIVDDPDYPSFKILDNACLSETSWRDCSTRAITELADCINTGNKTSCSIEDSIQIMKRYDQIISYI